MGWGKRRENTGSIRNRSPEPLVWSTGVSPSSAIQRIRDGSSVLPSSCRGAICDQNAEEKGGNKKNQRPVKKAEQSIRGSRRFAGSALAALPKRRIYPPIRLLPIDPGIGVNGVKIYDRF